MSEKNADTTQEIRKGLNGVVVDYTAVSKVVPETNSLTYRGYPVQELVEHCSFEDVAYLLWNKELPTWREYQEFGQRERALRPVTRGLLDLIASLPKTAHPMDVVRTAVSWLGTQDVTNEDNSSDTVRRTGVSLLAKLPAIIAYDMRRRRGLEFIPPSRTRGIASNFLYMCFGDGPDSPANNMDDVKAFDQSLILYAEHSFNASTFTGRVITSTTADVYSAVTGAIGALKGALHGGANEAVMHNFLEVDDPAEAEAWVLDKADNKQKIMGFGHRVYKKGDSRVPSMEAAMRRTAANHDGDKWVQMYDNMQAAMEKRTGILPNLDFPAGPTYYMLGIDIPFFTPIFVMARVVGWTAHIVEQNESNALIRPLSAYDGEQQRSVEENIRA
ncbi:MAG: bifunctional 2-methylcitrate synthase/citrate synthase [Corynebacterium sp.]|uniref:bifunctional 2-methylcitrate synthase/citrate synthase n=1 Tax=unclassified Corynebacterium TaxID=2624378 RepID=UPI00264A0EC3|nr:bifunctional 2-methylcitrate synthase/citrate synthase [Corynebacterium sp.]MDN5581033.1 bifunctional 2-methylcitrate synthase/citrate synthase [Corynebacterium sp.]MDN5719916.1 bifunctional 2-methylcitrate synthase/citrate synthase [Corynebacterium sp.]MDN6510210.1 bifunctional 2-methylcitrate synthase/citrate synthase [Corynebacterium sp.]